MTSRPNDVPGVELRLAQSADIPAITRLIEDSTRALSRGYYTEPEIESALRFVFGVDSSLIADGTYYVAHDSAMVVGSGGWSRRRTLYGGDQRPMGGQELLDPATDPARIRAFFVAPGAARRGVGRRMLERCAADAARAGFTSLELMATLPGVPFYSALGFEPLENVVDELPNGVPLRFVRMRKAIVTDGA